MVGGVRRGLPEKSNEKSATQRSVWLFFFFFSVFERVPNPQMHIYCTFSNLFCSPRGPLSIGTAAADSLQADRFDRDRER